MQAVIGRLSPLVPTALVCLNNACLYLSLLDPFPFPPLPSPPFPTLPYPSRPLHSLSSNPPPSLIPPWDPALTPLSLSLIDDGASLLPAIVSSLPASEPEGEDQDGRTKAEPTITQVTPVELFFKVVGLVRVPWWMHLGQEMLRYTENVPLPSSPPLPLPSPPSPPSLLLPSFLRIAWHRVTCSQY